MTFSDGDRRSRDRFWQVYAIVELSGLARPSSKAQFEKRTSPRKRVQVYERERETVRKRGDDGERGREL